MLTILSVEASRLVRYIKVVHSRVARICGSDRVVIPEVAIACTIHALTDSLTLFLKRHARDGAWDPISTWSRLVKNDKDEDCNHFVGIGEPSAVVAVTAICR